MGLAAGPGVPGDWLVCSVALEHAVDQAILEGLLGGEEAIALHVGTHLLLGEAGVLGVDLIRALTDPESRARGSRYPLTGLQSPPRAGGSGSSSWAGTRACL